MDQVLMTRCLENHLPWEFRVPKVVNKSLLWRNVQAQTAVKPGPALCAMEVVLVPHNSHETPLPRLENACRGVKNTCSSSGTGNLHISLVTSSTPTTLECLTCIPSILFLSTNCIRLPPDTVCISSLSIPEYHSQTWPPKRRKSVSLPLEDSPASFLSSCPSYSVPSAQACEASAYTKNLS